MSERDCNKQIWEPRGTGFHPCSRKGVIEEDGRHWCRQHAPSAVKARQEKSDARYDEQWRLDVERRTRRYACEAAFEGSDIPTERITPGLVKEMRDALGGGATGRDESIPTEIIPWLLKEADEWEPSGETYEKGYRSPTAEMLRAGATELPALRDVAEAARKAVAQADLFDEPEPHPDDMRLAIINIGDWLHAALDALAEAPDDKE